MKEHIEHQIIRNNGKPLFAIVPYDEYTALMDLRDRKTTLPHEVVGASVVEGKSMIRAWREYKTISQKEMAKLLGISQAAYSQMEKPGVRNHFATLRKIAHALDIQVDQLTDD